MGVPATMGRLCTTLSEMEIGDYISCEYLAETANVPGDFQNLGAQSTLGELSKTSPGATANGYFYFLKADKGLLIADRIVQSGCSGTGLNDCGYITGKFIGETIMIRLLSGAEYHKYLNLGDLNGNITKQSKDAWGGATGYYYSYPGKYTQQFIYLELVQNRSGGSIRTSVLGLGEPTGSYWLGSVYSGVNATYVWIGANHVGSYYLEHTNTSNWTHQESYSYQQFRPAIEYIDNPKSKTFWY